MEKNTKASRLAFFCKKDWISYAVILFLILGSFLFFLLLRPSEKKGFSVLLNNQTVLTYVYGDDAPDVSEGFSESVVWTKNGDTATAKIFTENGEYNVLTVNLLEESVFVSETTCPQKYCMAYGKLSDLGAICCLPHALTVVPIGNQGVLIVGGGQ